MKKTVTVPILDVALVFVDDAGEAQREYEKNRTAIEAWVDAKRGYDATDPELESICVGYVRDGGGIIIMCVTDGESIVHEAVHAAWEICKYSDIKADYKNQEPMSYLTQWIYDQWQEKMG